MEPMGFEQCLKQAIKNLYYEREEWNLNLAPACVSITHCETLCLLARSECDFRTINRPAWNLLPQ